MARWAHRDVCDTVGFALATLQACRHIPERCQRCLQMIDDLLQQHVRRRQVVKILPTVIFSTQQSLRDLPLSACAS